VHSQISPKIENILRKARDQQGIDKEEAQELLQLDLQSREVYEVMATANHISRELFGDKGENHFHIGVNVEPCPFNCRFCSLARNVGVFKETIEFTEEEIISWARQARAFGADAINLMTTGTYELSKLIDIAKILRKEVTTPLVANTRDINHAEGENLLDAGFAGFYHALRLGEGKDTPFSVEKRLETIKVIKDVGLQWMNCVEPVGPEHSKEEIAQLMVLARTHGATYSGVMRRINFTGSPFEVFGMIPEREMARMVAVSRLVMGAQPRAHCTHEPHSASLLAGANLFFPEVGASPRDSRADTGKGRGKNVEKCRQIFIEMGLNPDLPSNCFKNKINNQAEITEDQAKQILSGGKKHAFFARKP
jgi:biotin synthase